MKVISGNSNPDLALAIVEYLGISLTDATISRFSDMEIRAEINENIRGKDVFVIQSICTPANEYIMELLIIIDALVRASAKRITAVIPYYGYARQDRKTESRAPITAKLVANLITAAGANRVLTMDLHAGQIQGFFDIPVDHLYASTVLLDYLKRNFSGHLVIVSPDAGGADRARAYAKRLNADLAVVDKRREEPGRSEILNIIGEVSGKTAIIIDDMVDTAGTICNAAQVIAEKGAQAVYACCSHAVLSGPAVQRISRSAIERLIVTDSIPLSESAKTLGKITVVSVAELLAKAIHSVHNSESLKPLFV
ncbi:MAG: ribose-phosphate pyrophosphokinase [Candidatus Moranbacteria bacterium]|nr:ribose-phosphate pyrophosphokinase [Candidatus Moranbacteria bacterium]